MQKTNKEASKRRGLEMSSVAKVKEQVKNGQITTVNEFMKQKQDLIKKALPEHVTVERLLGVFEMLLKSNSELAGCTQKSLIGAIIQTAQLGLIPGNINHCYYVPFKNKQPGGGYATEVQFILGYKGMIELVNRSGKAVILAAECVYKNDAFDIEQGLNPILRHVPTEQKDRGEINGCYCIAKNLVAQEKVFVYLKKEDIDKVRKASKAGQSDFSPWNNWYEEMAKKTAVKRICKLLPLSMDVQKNISADETIKSEITPDMTEAKDETVWPGTGEVEDADFKSEETPKEKPSSEEQKKMADLELTIEAAINECETEDQLKIVEEKYKGKLINGSDELTPTMKGNLTAILTKKKEALKPKK